MLKDWQKALPVRKRGLPFYRSVKCRKKDRFPPLSALCLCVTIGTGRRTEYCEKRSEYNNALADGRVDALHPSINGGTQDVLAA